MASIDQVVDYYKDDFSKGLFPLDTNRIIIENAPQLINDYIYQSILKNDVEQHHFLPQKRCHAAKHGLHLRRTLKLDPIAEFYIYDLIYRNKTTFRSDFSDKRKSFGYRFENGKAISLSKAYREFKSSVAEANVKFEHGLKLDIASYFNSIYHHDLVKWFDNNRDISDINGFGQFLREINSGRSVDCLPQGIHPCKVIGAEFLKFIDNSRFLKSELILRFMDDIYLFSDKEHAIQHDFLLIQQLAGEKGLNFNNSKTKTGKVALENIDEKIEEVRKKLLYVRTELVETYNGEEEIQYEDELSLDPEQEEYLYSLLKNPELDELDAELILTFMSEKGEDVLEYLTVIFERFPNLSKKLFYFCRNIVDKSGLANAIQHHIDKSITITEEQLFWFAKIAEEYLSQTPEYSLILVKLLESSYSTDISKSKVLEIPEQRFGLPDFREDYLRVGRADWLSWSAAVGTRGMSKNNRNHILKYFRNASQMNYIIANTVMGL
ncbi:antiviral reverse transcriptase Drt5 [Hafnia paralvei]|uniref:antiviral reverse transcriptase Drt5 n=1 Tax=Hafnia paralvei TaxID=546367 RepID=UPI00163CECDF|nr:antiviral reverse transcriptase Drt5 [Hafnia paralvei]